ncbi:MAG: arabinan endo,5-alpha-L-arabinosidase [Clostridiales bacterium]|nr:arabinan endo,5-alpha-L-arabinosidase [Clostridiales bacterium]
MKRKEIYIRDPFIVPVYDEQKYYMFGTTDANCWNDEKATGFDYYTTTDLESFEGPFEAFRPPKDFGWDRNFWAPEVHYYKDQLVKVNRFFKKIKFFQFLKLGMTNKPIFKSEH